MRVICFLTFLASNVALAAEPSNPLPGTRVLNMTGDIASTLIDGVDRFLLRKIEESVDRRPRHWRRDTSSWEAYTRSISSNRQRLARMLGVRDERIGFDAMELVSTTKQGALVGRGQGYEIFAVRWPVFRGVHGEGLMLVPVGREKLADVVAVPDAQHTPEQLVGLTAGVSRDSQFARRLAESGCRVLVPVLISRDVKPLTVTKNRFSNREYLYRPSFELGRHIIGYEIQKILSCVDWFEKESGGSGRVGVMGWGEGGLLSLYAGALDTRIDMVCVSGHFGPRQELWKEPICRNVFGLLDEFGDAEIASMIAPRRLVVEAARGPEFEVLPGTGAGPGRLVTPAVGEVTHELLRARNFLKGLEPAARLECVFSDEGDGPFGSESALRAFLDQGDPLPESGAASENLRASFDVGVRQRRQIDEIDADTQWLMYESSYERAEFFKKLDLSSLESFEKTVEWYREYFYDEVIGRFDDPLVAPEPRTRRIFDEDRFTGYEVVLNVFPDVIAYGILLVPKGIGAAERRPVVVCQHGLEGRPRDVADPNVNSHYYNQYAVRLAERGFVTFAPQNLYIFEDRFRTFQRKGNLIKKTLFSIIVPQHQQIVDWLAALPFVDPERIAFYGLSYGGKTAMRVPPLVSRYCLSICSGDFNEWIWKNCSTRHSSSYVWYTEYEIFEFDLANTFNYAEMSALIAPRPFMVERGHFDGVGVDEWVGYEFAKVRRIYAARLKIPERCEIEWFDGTHTINGVGTFDFLHRHLKWPKE